SGFSDCSYYSLHFDGQPNHLCFMYQAILASVSIKKSNGAVKLQALIDRKKVIITKDTIRKNLRLDDADGVDCLPNEEIFAELARMGYEKPSTKTAWNEFSSSMASAVICLATDDLSSHKTKYTSPALTQKVFANMRRIGKGFLRVETPLFDAMLVQQPVQDDDAEVEEDEDDNEKVDNLEQDKIAQALEISKLKQRVRKLEKKRRTKHSGLKRLKKGRIAESQANVYNLDLQHSKKSLVCRILIEPADVEEVLEVVIGAKLMTEVVTTAVPITTAAQVPKPSAPRRRRGVIIHDPEETSTSVIVHSKIDMDEEFTRQLEAELNTNINWHDVLEQVKRREKQDNTVMRYQDLKRKPLNEAQARKNMMIYLKNMAGFKMDFFKATPLASKVHVVDYQIHHENNKPYYKILKADGTHKLFLSFITLLKNFNREDLETLWKLVKERFKSTKLKNFSDDFLLNTLKIMFEKPNVKANVWRDQKGRYGLAKVKS
nr:hypothetical protein [Tanacetum cinerariifolium]